MSLPLVVSAMKLHSNPIAIRNLRGEDLLKKLRQFKQKKIKENIVSECSQTEKPEYQWVHIVKESKEDKSNTINSSKKVNKKPRKKRASTVRTANEKIRNDERNSPNYTVTNLQSYNLRNSFSSPLESMSTITKVERRKKEADNRQTFSKSRYQKQSCASTLPQTRSHSTRNKLKKIYYSEAQSQVISGVPCVPPVSPINVQNLTVENVPCLADVKSQQLMKSRLRHLMMKREKAYEKLQEKTLKEEKEKAIEKVESLKRQHRLEIYALNKMMEEYERSKVINVINKNSGHKSPPISLKV